ncbi:glycerophosphodiester phosphodiesterase [Streptomyces sp. OR43]|uniref:glycerophosphodiester phosphodiesterase n=1 Tax=Streptomyces sp. or43 TaxID=2478957 RepID=UPI0011CD8AD5|nr:glycerophosphodiester phosphodiesterase [Streptomyces sp. or43]TXS35733.1 glycerophosphodiester phosphodiesterase [Streptomyces sp. or43]
MALPDGVPTVTVVDSRTHPDGGPMRGRVTLTPEAPAVTSIEHGHIVMGAVTGRWINGALYPASDPTGQGDAGLTVLPHDAPGYTPTGWTYRVHERPDDAPERSYPMLVAAAMGTIDLAAVAPVEPYTGDYVLVPGPPGPPGAPGSQANAEAYTDAAMSAEVTRSNVAYAPQAAVTITNLLATNPAYFGHRGQGMVSPEHTMAGYRAAVAAGAKAIEVSVNVAADGTLVCCHDTTLDRTTYSTGAVNTWNWSELKNRVLTNGRVLHGQGWTDQPIPTLREVLDEFLGRVVIFLEAKGNDAVVPLQTMLDTFYPTANKSVVWKAHIGTLSLPWAKGAGFKTWVYVDDGTTDAAITAKDQYIDYLGVQTSMADARVTQIVARGKPVFSWPVYRRSQRDRLAGLGVVGMMTSDIQYLSRSTPMRTASRWDNQVKEPGGTPTLDYDATYALKFDDAPSAGWVYINAAGQSYGLGTYCPIVGGAGGYRISFDMRFEGIPAITTEHAGVYFGKLSDDAYRFGTANASGGYHVVMRANGQMQLNRHTAGVTTGTALGTVQNTTAVVPDNPMSFQLDVTATTIELRRTDSTGWTTGPIADATYRGLYFGLSNGGITNLTTKPHWRNLVITQL